MSHSFVFQKLCFYVLYFVFIFYLGQNVFAIQKTKTVSKNEQEKLKGKIPSYSFRPLLIQGKKHVVQKAKDIKLDSGNVSESQLFFINIDFKNRMFESGE